MPNTAMNRFLRPGDQGSIELSFTDGDDRSQTPQRPSAFGDYEKPFPSSIAGTGVPATGSGFDASGNVEPGLADPTVYDVQTFVIPEGKAKKYCLSSL